MLHGREDLVANNTTPYGLASLLLPKSVGNLLKQKQGAEEPNLKIAVKSPRAKGDATRGLRISGIMQGGWAPS